jgi:hypothetical protein
MYFVQLFCAITSSSSLGHGLGVSVGLVGLRGSVRMVSLVGLGVNVRLGRQCSDKWWFPKALFVLVS